MYRGDNRERQLAWLRELSCELRNGLVGDFETPEEAVAYLLEVTQEPMPEWFDAHDQRVLADFVGGMEL